LVFVQARAACCNVRRFYKMPTKAFGQVTVARNDVDMNSETGETYLALK
jgi:hypothetical protein